MIGAILLASQGEYENHESWAVALFADIELATAHMTEIEQEVMRICVVFGDEDEPLRAFRLEADGAVSHWVRTPDDADERRHPDEGRKLLALGLRGPKEIRGDIGFHIVSMGIRGLGGAA